MKWTPAILSLVPLLALAEKLPDSAELPADGDAGAMEERFSAPAMDSGEMEALFLESPVTLGNEEDRSGMESLSDEERYRESDLLFRELRQSDSLNQPERPDSEPEAPNPPLRAPLDEL